MNITDVVWTRDHHGKPVLVLRLDGQPAHIRSGQKTELTDRGIVDGVVNGTAAGFGGLSGRLRKVQNGFARSYAVSMFGGSSRPMKLSSSSTACSPA